MKDEKVKKTDEQAEEVVETPQPVDAPADEHQESAPAEGSAPDNESTDEPAEEEQSHSVETPDEDAAPVESQAPAQEEEAPASAPSTPEPADDDTSEVEKSAIFGAYAQADAAEVSVRALTSDLCWEVWRAVYSDEEDERSKDERKAHVAAALAEYSQIVQSVANAFIENGVDASAEKSFVVPNEEAINKSLTEKDTKVEELTKSLSAKDEELSRVRKSLEESQSEVEKMKARKSLVFDKFAGAVDEEQKADDEAKAQEEANKLFANFVITGAK